MEGKKLKIGGGEGEELIGEGATSGERREELRMGRSLITVS